MEALLEIFGKVRHTNRDYTTSGEVMFVVGVLINCWDVSWCCLASFFVIGAALTPQQLVFDSLALFFLFTLDDIGSLGFITKDDWPGLHLAWVHSECIVLDRDSSRSHKDWRLSFADKGMLRCFYQCTRWTVTFCSRMSNLCLGALPLLAIVTPFTQVVTE